MKLVLLLTVSLALAVFASDNCGRECLKEKWDLLGVEGRRALLMAALEPQASKVRESVPWSVDDKMEIALTAAAASCHSFEIFWSISESAGYFPSEESFSEATMGGGKDLKAFVFDGLAESLGDSKVIHEAKRLFEVELATRGSTSVGSEMASARYGSSERIASLPSDSMGLMSSERISSMRGVAGGDSDLETNHASFDDTWATLSPLQKSKVFGVVLKQDGVVPLHLSRCLAAFPLDPSKSLSFVKELIALKDTTGMDLLREIPPPTGFEKELSQDCSVKDELLNSHVNKEMAAVIKRYVGINHVGEGSGSDPSTEFTTYTGMPHALPEAADENDADENDRYLGPPASLEDLGLGH